MAGGRQVTDADELMHELGPEESFNESMYTNAIDASGEVGAWFRVGNRANEGRSEMSVCIYLPGGRVGFQHRRTEITKGDNSRLDTAGCRFEVVEPWERMDVTYDGTVVLLDEPMEMNDPRRAFKENPEVSCTVDLRFGGVGGRGGVFGGESDAPEKPGEEFARGHYEQLMTATGTITVDGQTYELDGAGLRDHSWGPRSWQSPYYYRWLTANLGRDAGFVVSRVARRDRDGVRAGFVWEDGRMHFLDDVRLSTGWTGDSKVHQQVDCTMSSKGREWKVKGEVLSLIPLRNRRQGDDGEMMVTRISEGMTRWTMDDGRVGHGLSEYLDQIVDGAPVGVAE